MGEHYVGAFEENGFDLWEIIRVLTVSDLKEAGIKAGHAIRMRLKLPAVNELKDDSASDLPPPAKKRKLNEPARTCAQCQRLEQQHTHDEKKIKALQKVIDCISGT